MDWIKKGKHNYIDISEEFTNYFKRMKDGRSETLEQQRMESLITICSRTTGNWDKEELNY